VSYIVGQTIRLTATFTGQALPDGSPGPLIDPTTITLRFEHQTQSPAIVYTYPATIVRDSLGIYHQDITILAPGVWIERWEGTSLAANSAAEKTIAVTASQIV
jgi:hypothetical protein